MRLLNRVTFHQRTRKIKVRHDLQSCKFARRQLSAGEPADFGGVIRGSQRVQYHYVD
jgi:hypothetical protein